MTEDFKHSLLSSDTSRQNKIWLATGWSHFHGWYIEWKWKDRPMRSRMMFRFSPDEEFVEAKSFDEDVKVKFKSGKDKNEGRKKEARSSKSD